MKEYLKLIKSNYKIKNHIANYCLVLFILFTVIFTIINPSITNQYGYTYNGFKGSTLALFEQIGYGMLAALSLSLVVGFLGELSLGHAGFMSIGAMFGTLARQTILRQISESAPLISLILAMLIGGLVASIFGLLIGIPTLRLKGDYLAIVTLAFGEIVNVVFSNIDLFGAERGLTNEFRYNSKYLFIIIFVTLFLVLVAIENLIKSKHGRAIMAIRDNEIAAKAMGVNVTFYKILVFVISAFIAGVAGVFFGASTTLVTPTTFNYNYSINNILVMVVLGGMGTINGTLIASFIVTFLNVKLISVFTGNLANFKNIVYALVLILVVIYNNAKIFKPIREKYNIAKLIKFIKKKFFKKDPNIERGVIKDYKADWTVVPSKIEMDSIVSTKIKGEKKHE